MFIARLNSATLLCSEDGICSNLSGIAMPLFRTEPEEHGFAGYKHCTPPE